MKLKSALLSVILTAALPCAFAEDISTSVPLISNGTNLSASFGVTHAVEQAFTDTFTFTPTIPLSFVDASLATIGFTPIHNVDLATATLNGTPLSLSPTGVFETGTLNPTILSGDLTLVVTGTAGANASYAGTLNVSPVPEPATYGMLLGGLAMLGAIARRRKQDDS